jgi:hypothetical protein
MPNHHRGDGSIISSFELMKGRKLNYNLDLKLGFDEYVQVENPQEINRNTMIPRTEGCISLWSVGNQQGSYKFLSLTSFRVITRDRWFQMPMPQEVIELLNQKARNNPYENNDVTFQYGKNMNELTEIIDDDNDPKVDDEPQVSYDVIEGPPLINPLPTNENNLIPNDSYLKSQNEVVNEDNVMTLDNNNRYNLRSKHTYEDNDPT